MKSDYPQAGVVLPAEKNYPFALTVLYKKLPLYYRGNFSLLSSKRTLAVVGSRVVTSVNRSALTKILSPIHDRDLTIVSGLALGCDGLAHELALENHLPAIAVLGSSVEDNEIYPATNTWLAREILSSGGLLLSPFAPGTDIMPYNFPIRNQIIAALAQATVIVSAAKKSGALITARLALEYGKDVFAIPGMITDPLYEGNNLLLQEGATPLLSADDILNYFNLPGVADKNYTTTGELEAQMISVLKNQQSTANDLSRALKTTSQEISAVLSNFEVKGWIMTLPDGKIQLL